MDRETIREKLIAVLCDIQLEGGYDAPTITDQTRPLQDLEGFDSPLAVEATSKLSQVIGIMIPAGVNVFKANDIARALTLSETVDVLVRLATANGRAAGGDNGQATDSSTEYTPPTP